MSSDANTDKYNYDYILYVINNKEIVCDGLQVDHIIMDLYGSTCRPVRESDIDDKETKIPSCITKKNISALIAKTKIYISKLETRIPLYDSYSQNILPIDRYAVYDRVMYDYYRFPNKEIIDLIKSNFNADPAITDQLILGNNNKILHFITFMDYFDNDILYQTYVNVFYKYSIYCGKEITLCKKPSFLPIFTHITPYFTKNEVINMALNNGEIPIKIGNYNDIDDNELIRLCKSVSKNEMSHEILMNHKKYMMHLNALGLIQFYTLQGAFFMNQYLRNNVLYKHRNAYLESLITPMWKTVVGAPAFDKRYTLYRFIKNDDYLVTVNIGDTFTESGFMSSTRDPFHFSQDSYFGFILIKINIPKDIPGIALCLETISSFPTEQEVIFPPNSRFKLMKKNLDCVYHHTDDHITAKVKVRYEFDWLENGPILFTRTLPSPAPYNVDFLTIPKNTDRISIIDKIKAFAHDYVNTMDQFELTIDGNTYTVMIEWYNSTSAYSKMYGLRTQHGFSMYSIKDGHMLFFIEIAEIESDAATAHKQPSGTPTMCINYYVNFNSLDHVNLISDTHLVTLYASIAHYFDIHKITIYANMMCCDRNIQYDNINIYGGKYCIDIYQYYVSSNKKYADILNIEMHPQFSYYDLDTLKKLSPSTVFVNTDGEIYQVYDKIYVTSGIGDNMAAFYVWLADTRCYLLSAYVAKLDMMFGESNPFRVPRYNFDATAYLYNRKIITTYSSQFRLSD